MVELRGFETPTFSDSVRNPPSDFLRIRRRPSAGATLDTSPSRALLRRTLKKLVSVRGAPSPAPVAAAQIRPRRSLRTMRLPIRQTLAHVAARRIPFVLLQEAFVFLFPVSRTHGTRTEVEVPQPYVFGVRPPQTLPYASLLVSASTGISRWMVSIRLLDQVGASARGRAATASRALCSFGQSVMRVLHDAREDGAFARFWSSRRHRYAGPRRSL